MSGNRNNLYEDEYSEDDDFPLVSKSKYNAIQGSIQTEGGKDDKPTILTQPLLISVAIFFALLLLQIPVAELLQPPEEVSDSVPLETRLAAARCLALFAMVVGLWATNALPLYITALLVAPVSVFLKVYLVKIEECDVPCRVMEAGDAADNVLKKMGSNSVFMVLGVYVLSAALQKTNFETIMSRAIFSIAKSSLSLIATCMVLSVILSLFFSNVLAPVLLLSILTPLFHSLGPDNSELVKAIILSISVSSNIGGMPSPVASPQNIVTEEYLQPEGGVPFGQWMAVTLPQCVGMLVLGFILIVLRFRVYSYQFDVDDHVDEVEIELTQDDYIVFLTFFVTVFLWVFPIGARLFGKTGVVSVIPIVVLFGTQTLSLNDFKNLPWHVVYLVAGGSVMGGAIQSSQLLNLIAFKLSKVLGSVPLYFAYLIVLLFMGVVASGISHTVSAIIVLPLVRQVGLDLGYPKLLVMGGVLAASGAMGLPVSSFPNISAFGVLDPFGLPYLTAQDILLTGVPMTFACSLVIGTIGYAIMRAAFPFLPSDKLV